MPVKKNDLQYENIPLDASRGPRGASQDILFIVRQPAFNQIESLELFTHNPALINYLKAHGYVTGNSLVTQIISCIGQRRSRELLKQFDAEKLTAALDLEIYELNERITADPSNPENLKLARKKINLEKQLTKIQVWREISDQ